MHHVVVERWSRGSSPLHARDARAKLGALLVFLIAVSTTPARPFAFVGYAALLAAAVAAARLPALALLRRAALVLPFSATFVLITYFSGDPPRAWMLFEKSFLSGLAALILIATTPFHDLLRGLESLRVPRPLILIIQFLYRYLFVISEEAQHMRKAAASRGTPERRLASAGARFRAAAGALAVLFARSYARAQDLHRAMLARGFAGRLPAHFDLRFRFADAAFLAFASLAPLAARIAVEGLR